MKKLILSSLICLACCIAFKAQDELAAAINKMTAEASKPENFVPKGWKILSQAKGDLNGDGLADYALDVSPEEATGESFNDAVVILFAERGGKLRRYAVNDQLSPCAGSGFECWQDLTIEKGVLVAGSNFGNNYATDTTYRFRFDPATDKLMLIGFDYETYTRAGNDNGDKRSFNFLTGIREDTTNYIDRRKNAKQIYDKSETKRTRIERARIPFEKARFNSGEDNSEPLPY